MEKAILKPLWGLIKMVKRKRYSLCKGSQSWCIRFDKLGHFYRTHLNEIIPWLLRFLKRRSLFWWSLGILPCQLLISFSASFFLLNLGLGSFSTTDSTKSWGVMYTCPSYSTEANRKNRFSRAVNRRFCESGLLKWSKFVFKKVPGYIALEVYN